MCAVNTRDIYNNGTTEHNDKDFFSLGELFKDVLNLYIETKTRKIVVRLEGKRIFYRVLLYVDSKSDDQKEIDTKMKIRHRIQIQSTK